jgi:hypothetical protein
MARIEKPTRADWRKAYDLQITEEAKIRYLLRLKEKRDCDDDQIAAELLLELVPLWVKTRWKA